MQIQQSIASLIGGAIDDSIGSDAVAGAPDRPSAWNAGHMDKIRRSPFPSWPSTAGAAGGLGAILSQIMNLLQQLMSALGASAQPFFNSAQGSSQGDPHLAFDGTTGTGTQQARFDSMDDHPDLLDSNSFRGGFQIATEVTRPDANGVTFNRRAAVTTNFGATQVSLDNHGQARITRNGKSTLLSAGQSLQLGRSESVVRNADGSVVISETNESGGSITTTLRDSGPGVDVSVAAQAVQLGGDLVRHP
ncbi:MAG TPA: hypothetical protein VFO29_01850 [Candidatus Rubrimentiphilum sp.]|nr:hypothetical protein [Candidatus Rubrimentiphilum sp.]